MDNKVNSELKFISGHNFPLESGLWIVSFKII